MQFFASPKISTLNVTLFPKTARRKGPCTSCEAEIILSLYAQSRIPALCPENVAIRWPVSKSQTFRIPSSLPVTKLEPRGESAVASRTLSVSTCRAAFRSRHPRLLLSCHGSTKLSGCRPPPPTQLVPSRFRRCGSVIEERDPGDRLPDRPWSGRAGWTTRGRAASPRPRLLAPRRERDLVRERLDGRRRVLCRIQAEEVPHLAVVAALADVPRSVLVAIERKADAGGGLVLPGFAFEHAGLLQTAAAVFVNTHQPPSTATVRSPPFARLVSQPFSSMWARADGRRCGTIFPKWASILARSSSSTLGRPFLSRSRRTPEHALERRSGGVLDRQRRGVTDRNLLFQADATVTVQGR